MMVFWTILLSLQLFHGSCVIVVLVDGYHVMEAFVTQFG
jgi:hypothetical protein